MVDEGPTRRQIHEARLSDHVRNGFPYRLENGGDGDFLTLWMSLDQSVEAMDKTILDINMINDIRWSSVVLVPRSWLVPTLLEERDLQRTRELPPLSAIEYFGGTAA